MNELFRDHVTGGEFVLTLHRSQIAALVALNEGMRRQKRARRSGPIHMRRAFSLFASGMRGLLERGLVLHHFSEAAVRSRKPTGFRPHYTITRAGKLTIELLKECGLYAEYAGELEDEQSAS